jgi:hypothetical protein
MLKTLGYLVSTLSVVLLGIVSWSTALAHPPLMACLVGGMAASVMGMGLRWLSYLHEQLQKRRDRRAVPSDQRQGSRSSPDSTVPIC